MSYQNIMNAPLFDFGDTKKSENTIKNTWNEFRVALANKTFTKHWGQTPLKNYKLIKPY